MTTTKLQYWVDQTMMGLITIEKADEIEHANKGKRVIRDNTSITVIR